MIFGGTWPKNLLTHHVWPHSPQQRYHLGSFEASHSRLIATGRGWKCSGTFGSAVITKTIAGCQAPTFQYHYFHHPGLAGIRSGTMGNVATNSTSNFGDCGGPNNTTHLERSDHHPGKRYDFGNFMNGVARLRSKRLTTSAKSLPAWR